MNPEQLSLATTPSRPDEQIGSGLRNQRGEQTGSDVPGVAAQRPGSSLRNPSGEQSGVAPATGGGRDRAG